MIYFMHYKYNEDEFSFIS